MAREPHSDFRFESVPVVTITMAVLVVGFAGFLIWALARDHVTGVIILGILLAFAGVTGMVLERVDSSRRREQGSRPGQDEPWGFRGRPGS
jgi:predicted outer membrane lipoprotein